MSTNEQLQLNAHLRQLYQDCLNGLQQKYLEHSSGFHPLPPSESLALRSHISHLAKILAPDMHEAWPPLSTAEKNYLAEQAEARKNDANLIGIAALGPFAAPAVGARMMGAPAEVQSNLLEIGFNAMAFGHYARTGPRLRVVSVPVKQTGEMSSNVTMEAEPVEIKNQTEHVAVSNLEKEASQHLAADMELLQNWRLKDQRNPALIQQLMYKLGAGGHAELMADIRSSRTIDDIKDVFASYPEGLEDAEYVLQEFSKRLHGDIMDKHGNVDNAQFRNVLVKIREGKYIQPKEYAAMDYVREYIHMMGHMEPSLEVLSRMPFTSVAMKAYRTELIKQFEADSPYRKITPSEPVNPKSTLGGSNDVANKRQQDIDPER